MNKMNKKDLIRKSATALLKSLIIKSEAVRDIENKQLKGILRELFVSEVLRPYLGTQFGFGNGVIINQRGDQSHQTDIIIYENQLLPSFIAKGNIGIYPAESVLAAIEIKSHLRKTELKNAEVCAKYLNEEIYDPRGSDSLTMLKPPINAVFGFYGNGARELNDESTGTKYLIEEAKNLNAICLVGKFSWTTNYEAKVNDPREWEMRKGNSKTNNETKSFLAFIIDKIRYLSNNRVANSKLPQRWIEKYIIDQ